MQSEHSLSFKAFCETCASIAATASKLEKIRLLAGYLRVLEAQNVSRAATWFTGKPFAGSENKVLQLGWALLRDALCVVGRVDEADFHQVYLKHSDVGETAFEILRNHEPRPPAPALDAIDSLFHEIAAARGPGAKRPLLVRGIEHCSALEAKFLVKILTGDLRIGLKEGLVEEAIAAAFEVQANAVRQANLLLGNIGETARLAKENKLATACVTPFRPIKFMLASPAETAAAIWERVQRRSEAVGQAS